MNFWNFIYDEEELCKLLTILKPLKDNETYFALSCARNKYLEDKTIKMRNTEVLDRKLIRELTRDKLVKNITKLGIPENFYGSKEGQPYPFESYVLYMTVNPRDMMKATYQCMTNMSQMMYDSFKNKSEIQKSKRLDVVTMSEIQASTGSKYFLDIDIDIKEKGIANEQLWEVRSRIFKGAKTYPIVTRGGYHCLVEISTIPQAIKNTFYKDLEKLSAEMKEHEFGDIEFKSDSMIPIPGTIQGGFKVKIID